MDDFQTITGLVGRLPTSYGDENKRPGELGRDDFLKLLMVQLRYQDPMSPMDTYKFAEQLTQYTTVEELRNLNISMDQGIQADIILAQSINNTLAATLIGKGVKASGDKVSVTDGKASGIGYELKNTADAVTVTIRDESGTVVRTLTEDGVPAGEHSIEWDGKNDNGDKVSDGTYTVEVKTIDSSGEENAVETFILGIVTAVRYEASGAVLIVGEISIAFGDVIELREPPEESSDILRAIGLR